MEHQRGASIEASNRTLGTHVIEYVKRLEDPLSLTQQSLIVCC